MKHKSQNHPYKNYTVLMSVYDRDVPEYIEVSIASMLTQTIPPEQFVIVLDGPVPEKIHHVLNKFKNNKNFTILQLPENGGLGKALNVGLKACRNELVARMDADDISLPSRCEKELEMFNREQDLVICGCNIDEFSDNPDNIKRSRIVPGDYEGIKHFMRRRQAFNHPTVMYKKTPVLKAGGYEPLKRKEDFDLFSKMLAQGNYARNIGESLYLYRANENNYKRRKSVSNLKSALHVYHRHLSRGGCSRLDYLIICAAEIFFFISPYPVMRYCSDVFLRKRIN